MQGCFISMEYCIIYDYTYNIKSNHMYVADSDPFIERNALEMDQELTVASNPSDKDTFWYDNSVKSNPVALEDPSTPH